MNRSAALSVVAILLVAGVAPVTAAGATTPHSVAVTDDGTTLDDAPTPEADTGTTEASSPEDDAGTADNNTTRRLPLTGPVRGNYSSVDLDFAASIAFSGERVQSQYQTTLVTVQLDQVQSQSAQEAIVEAYLDGVENELESLTTAETQAVQRYESGEIDASALLVRLAMVDRRARAVEDSMDRIQRTDAPIPQRLRSIRMELEAFESPIRQHVALAATGELKGAVNSLHVTAADDGVVVEMLDDRRYHRNAVRFDNRAPGSVDQFGGNIDRFRSRVAELYPWSYQGSLRRNPAIDTHLSRNLYRITYRHPQGSIAVYVDGGTTDVAREHQSLVLDRLPKSSPTIESKDNVSVRVTPTLEGGPVAVNVTRPGVGNESATPLDAVVRANNHTAGRTGADGDLWLIRPATDYEITVEYDGTTVNVSAPSASVSNGVQTGVTETGPIRHGAVTLPASPAVDATARIVSFDD
ncbi:hypothetical protein G9C85_09700 [Halorubellus sp. JP-L1]|uniref:DUF7094 domain-containing protein n=1 Tax=Halorubellus sp. JP-L1 TaxID=2715753 RepID=UPI001408F93B|nr:hypothetical protein [Halorubellus sp. JP-L1]NHN41900.1 hypothetical protein [Halorubellus sp. JP-L1]